MAGASTLVFSCQELPSCYENTIIFSVPRWRKGWRHCSKLFTFIPPTISALSISSLTPMAFILQREAGHWSGRLWYNLHGMYFARKESGVVVAPSKRFPGPTALEFASVAARLVVRELLSPLPGLFLWLIPCTCPLPSSSSPLPVCLAESVCQSPKWLPASLQMFFKSTFMQGSSQQRKTLKSATEPTHNQIQTQTQQTGRQIP